MLSLPTKLILKFLDPSGRIYKTPFTGVSGMRITRHVSHHNKMLHIINHLGLFRFQGRTREKSLARRNVDKTDRMHLRMNVFFHGNVAIAYSRLDRSNVLNYPCRALKRGLVLQIT